MATHDPLLRPPLPTPSPSATFLYFFPCQTFRHGPTNTRAKGPLRLIRNPAPPHPHPWVFLLRFLLSNTPLLDTENTLFSPLGDYSASSVTPSPSNIPHPPGMVLYSPAKLTLHGHTNTLSLSHPFFSLLVDSSASSVTPALSNTSPPIRHHISYFSPCQTHPSWTHRYTFLLTLHQCVA